MMGLSLAYGRSRPDQPVEQPYAAVQRLVHAFEQEFGARECDRLLGCDLNTPEGQTRFQEERLGERCARYTARATEIAAELLLAPRR